MKSFIKEIFQDNAGGFSMQRFGTAVCLFAFLSVTGVILYLALNTKGFVLGEAAFIAADITVINALIMLDLGILTDGLGIKAFQRFGEKENNIEPK